MKQKWKVCVLSGSILVCSILGALILLNGIMSSADGKKKTFVTEQVVTGEAVAAEEAEEQYVEECKENKELVEELTEKERQVAKAKADSDDIMTEEYLAEYQKAQIAYYAERYEGARYVYGGEELPQVRVEKKRDTDGGFVRLKTVIVETESSGVDSSGFVKAIFKYFDIELPRSVSEQAETGTEVKVKDVQRGDVVFYGSGDKDMMTHCGIYIGKGKVIHASSQAKEVIVSDINYRRIAKVMRYAK